MKEKTLIICILLALGLQKASSQNAPVITVGTIVSNAQTITVPVTVTNFISIGSSNLQLNYDPAIVMATVVTPNPLLVGTWDANVSNAGVITIGWFASAMIGVTLPDNTVMFNIKFTKVGSGTTPLTWFDNGMSCLWYNSSITELKDTPTSSFYINGSVTIPQAPRTSLPDATAAPGNLVNIPVTVADFKNIGAFSLTMLYSSSALVYQSFTNTSGFPGVSVSSPSAGKIKALGTTAAGDAGITLPDNTVLFTLTFLYNGGTSSLNWTDDGVTCEYADNNYQSLFDVPTASYYKNGSVSQASNLLVNVKVFLEGPYSGGTMSTSLKTKNLIPLTQPYSGNPWNYNGTEAVASIPANVTDWILVELRTGTAASTKVATRAGFLKNNGSITDLDGTSLLNFNGLNAGSYYIVVRHRNHMPVMSAATVLLSASGTLYDFSSGTGQVYRGANGCKNLDASHWAMVAGDASNDGSIFINDYTNFWVPASGIISSYNRSDFNLDGDVYINDYTNYWVPNSGKSNTLP